MKKLYTFCVCALLAAAGTVFLSCNNASSSDDLTKEDLYGSYWDISLSVL